MKALAVLVCSCFVPAVGWVVSPAASHATAQPLLARRPMVLPRAVAADGDLPDDSPSALELSRELAKVTTKGMRLRQSGPVRRSWGALTSFAGGIASTVSSCRQAVEAVPVHGGLMLVTLAAYGVQNAAPRAAMLAGARNNAAINAGQWHRLVSPVLLHGGGMHLLSNLFSLWRVGPLVQSAYGPARALCLYLLSGIGGNLAGLAWGAPRGMSVGASGAVFGLIGATGGHVLRNKRALGSYGDALLQNVGYLLMINLFIGTRRGSGIDNLAHLGGFASGAIIGVLLSPKVGGRRDWRGGPADEVDGDGALLPAWGFRALFAATAIVYAAGLREAVRMALAVVRVYGRR